MISVLYDNRQDAIEITADKEDAIKRPSEAVLIKEGLKGDFEVSVSFVTNEEIKDLNKEYKKCRQ